MYRAHRKTDATAEPVTVPEVKEHIVDDWSADDDSRLAGLIKAARQRCEAYSNRAYITQTWVLKLKRFESVIELPMPNLISVTSFKYTTSDGSETTLVEDTDFAVDTDVEPGIIYFPEWVNSIPCDASGEFPITIEYTCGYGASKDDVPQHIKQAILLEVGHLNENRESTVIGAGIAVSELINGTKALLDIDRVVPI